MNIKAKEDESYVDDRYGPAARQHDPGGGVLQGIPGRAAINEETKQKTKSQRISLLVCEEREKPRLMHTSGELRRVLSALVIRPLNVDYFFRILTMTEISVRISDLISEAYSKGHAPGEVRKMVIDWCVEYLFTDSSEMQQGMAEHLRIRQCARIIKLEAAHLVQAVKIRELVPVAQRQDSCACWESRLQECGLCEYSLKDRSFVAGLHHATAKGAAGMLMGCGITVQYEMVKTEAEKVAAAGLLFKLLMILLGRTGEDIRRRMIFSPIELKHHKMMIVESTEADKKLLAPLNMVLMTWQPFLSTACGLPEDALPSRVFVTVPSSQTGSFFAACTDASSFKEKEVIKGVALPLEDFPKRVFQEKVFRAAADEPLIASLKDYQGAVEDILERTRGQMAANRRFLVKIGVLQGFHVALNSTEESRMRPVELLGFGGGSSLVESQITNIGREKSLRLLATQRRGEGFLSLREGKESHRANGVKNSRTIYVLDSPLFGGGVCATWRSSYRRTCVRFT